MYIKNKNNQFLCLHKFFKQIYLLRQNNFPKSYFLKFVTYMLNNKNKLNYLHITLSAIKLKNII